jgi:REP element-mobilizing transposase RayT
VFSFQVLVVGGGVEKNIDLTLCRRFKGRGASWIGCEILEQNIRVDHIHLLMVIPPKYAVSEVIGQLKQYTANRLREKFAWLDEVYWKERVVWSPCYFVSIVGLDEKQITVIGQHVHWHLQPPVVLYKDKKAIDDGEKHVG